MKNLNIKEYDCIQLTTKEANSVDGGLIFAMFIYGLVIGVIFGLMIFD